jgi:mono/diheme cytochrome c family protein
MKIPRIAGIAAIAVVALSACGGGSSPTTTASTQATTTAIVTTTAAVATTQATATTAGATTTTAAAVTTTAGGGEDELVAMGKVLYEETAGGIGCAYCHGLDGLGKPELASPDIRGKGISDIVDALATRAQMTTIVLSDAEIKAVAAYLQTLN